MMCPHCGEEAGSQSFCPSCSRLVRSPLLGMHRELAESRGKTYGAEAIAAAAAARARDLAATQDRELPPVTSGASSAPARAITDTMRKALERRDRKAKGRPDNADDDGAASSTARAEHSGGTHTIDDTSAPPPLPVTRAPAKAEPVPERMSRPAAITVLVLLNAIAGLALLGLASVLWDGEQLRPLTRTTAPFYVSGSVGILHLLAALGLRGLNPFGRLVQKLLAFLGLFMVPLGTVYSLILFAYFRSPGVNLLFTGRSPRSLNATELAAWRKAQKFSPAMAIVFFVLALLPAFGMVEFAASVIPTVLDAAWSAKASLQGNATPVDAPAADPEAQAHADVAAMMAAQAAYAGLDGGLYDRVECVVAPQACIGAEDPRKFTSLLDQRFTQAERGGYVFRLVLGGRPASRPDGASATGVEAYAYTAVSVARTGLAICGDSSGALVQLDVDVAAALRTAKCPDPE